MTLTYLTFIILLYIVCYSVNTMKLIKEKNTQAES